MTRQLQPCGTEAAYKRHVRAGEPPCPECSSAHRREQRDRDRGSCSSSSTRPVLTLVPTTTEERIDRLERARWALGACESAIAADRPGLAGLIREHSRLVELIAMLEDNQVIRDDVVFNRRDERFDPSKI